MFVRKNRNRSGTTSVQIVSKSRGRYCVSQTLGCSSDPDEIERLVERGKSIISNPKGQLNLLSRYSSNAHTVENFVSTLSNANVRVVGPELIFGTLFDRIGFNKIPDELFRHITLARLVYPSSKLKTVDYLQRYQGVYIDKHAVYRFLDKLHSEYKEQAEKIAYAHTKNVLRNITVVFYDMTTLYFEAEDEDDLRKIGFSKDGKFQQPQIMLGLLVGQDGYPIGYDIFEGNTFEGRTLLPILERFKTKYDFETVTVVADAGLLSKDNIKALEDAKYQFIVGARIKNETDETKSKILTQSENIKDNQSFEIQKSDSVRLIVSYSAARAKKDASNRQKGIKRLKAKIKSGKLTKEHINNRGYNKFLTLSGEISVGLDDQKLQNEIHWDGLKGYITNARLSHQEILSSYRNLWRVEQAFRISKTDLRIRPIFHYKRRRIEAHICITFVAYTIYKELERILAEAKADISAKRAAELTQTMYQIEFTLPGEVIPTHHLLKMDNLQQKLFDIINR